MKKFFCFLCMLVLLVPLFACSSGKFTWETKDVIEENTNNNYRVYYVLAKGTSKLTENNFKEIGNDILKKEKEYKDFKFFKVFIYMNQYDSPENAATESDYVLQYGPSGNIPVKPIEVPTSFSDYKMNVYDVSNKSKVIYKISLE